MTQENLQKNTSDQIDLSVFFNIFYNAKLEILCSIVFLAILSNLYYWTCNHEYELKIRLTPINLFEAEAYTENNTDGYFSINAQELYSIFLVSLRDTDKLQQFVKDSHVLKRNKYKTDSDYESGIRALADRVSLIEHIVTHEGSKDKTSEWGIVYHGQDDIDIKKFMVTLIDNANEFTRQFFITRYERKIALKAKYDNLKTEDLKQETKNAYDDYKRETSDRLAFLTEQAKIARSLNISNNTLETQDFNSSDTQILTSVKVDQPYYLHGYKSIEKEIELIKKRVNVSAFVPGLYAKEKSQRSIDQDLTVKRSKDAMDTSPLYVKEKFKAINMSGIDQTNLKLLSNTLTLYMYLIMSVIIGIILGVIIHHFNKAAFLQMLTELKKIHSQLKDTYNKKKS